MPITKSAKKALRQSVTRKKRNTVRKEVYKKEIKDIKALLSAKNTADAEKKLSTVYKALDKAAKTGAIKKNKASRLKSRIAKKFKKA
jgi:small subunit ribosomal protein S20